MLNVVHYKEVNKGSVKGLFDVEIPKWGMTIYGCAHFCMGQKEWVNPPARKVEKEGDKPSYLPYVRFSGESNAKFQAACIEAIRKIVNSVFDSVSDDIN